MSYLAIFLEMVIFNTISDVKCKEKKTRSGTSVVCFVVCVLVRLFVLTYISPDDIALEFSSKKKQQQTLGTLNNLTCLTVHVCVFVLLCSVCFLIGNGVCVLCMMFSDGISFSELYLVLFLFFSWQRIKSMLEFAIRISCKRRFIKRGIGI